MKRGLLLGMLMAMWLPLVAVAGGSATAVDGRRGSGDECPGK